MQETFMILAIEATRNTTNNGKTSTHLSLNFGSHLITGALGVGSYNYYSQYSSSSLLK